MHAESPTLTLLFTDIEGSTRLWDNEPASMAEALASHDLLCRKTIAAHGGRVVKMMGDGLHAVFEDAAAAIASVVDLQHGLGLIAAQCKLPLKMRCGLHAGTPQERDGDYFGSSVNRAARIMSAAHGGQVLLSQAAVDAASARIPAPIDVRPLGRVRLRDLSAPEIIWQLVHPGLPNIFPPLRSLDSTPNNLPQQVTSFVGRDQEIAEVKALLRKKRLVTLVGSGGAGKTRLSLQIAADLLDMYPDGVFLVELAAIANPDLVPQAVAKVLGLREGTGEDLLQIISAHLASRQILLLLDNAEHLLQGCAQLADNLLRHCPLVFLLASSREPLRVPGEISYPVPSLPVPDEACKQTPERIAGCESVRLFIERAELHSPHFALSQQNAMAVASICRRLDGIPLAIELAAARLRSMSVDEVNQRLDGRLLQLTGGSRTALPRQQTLRALIDWSYTLLVPAEKQLFGRLAIFSGSWTLDAAESICSGEDPHSTVEWLSSLCDKSLVVAQPRGGTTRYRMLGVVHEYAREQLRDTDETNVLRGRHLAYFRDFAVTARESIFGNETQEWIERLESEQDNMRAALAWSCSDRTKAADALQLANNLFDFWTLRGYFAEGKAWLDKVLALAPSDQTQKARSTALNGLGILAMRQGDYPSARAAHEESLSLRRASGHKTRIAISLINLANVASQEGDFSYAQPLYEEGLAIAREINDPAVIVAAQMNLASLASMQQRYAVAETSLVECIASLRHDPDQAMLATGLTVFGEIVLKQGDPARAGTLFGESLAIAHRLNVREGIPNSLEGLARVALAVGKPARAAVLWGAAERLRTDLGCPLPPNDKADHGSKVTSAHHALADDAAFNCAWNDGRAMSLERAVEYALGSGALHP